MTIADPDTASLRCAAVIREAGIDPIGTAGSYAGYLLVEWPLPWPRDLGDDPVLADLHAALRGTGIRLQGLVPRTGDGGPRRVIRHALPEGPEAQAGFAGYRRSERVVAADELLDAALALAAGDGDPTPAGTADDVLVCTHGKRDVCCGSLGTSLVLELTDGLRGPEGDARLWRTSHTGGHRFAPTAIVLPQGTTWAFLDVDALRRITARQGPLDDLLPRYRGCPALGSPAVQAVEREAFADVGWAWLDWRRQGEELADGTTLVTGTSPGGEERSWSAVVEVARLVPVPECGLPIDAAKKSEPELRVRDVRRG